MARGIIHHFRGDHDAAVADCRRAFALNPIFAINLFTMAWCESLSGFTEEAREHAALGLRLSPRDSELWLGVAYLALAQASFADGDFEETRKWGKLSIQMHPRAPIRRALMIACCVHDGEFEQAREHVNFLDSFVPDFIEDYPDDENAVAVASEAMEACSFELPVAYFGTKLDTVQGQLTASPESPRPCNDFVREFTVYFSVAGEAPPNAVDTEERVKAALSERAREVCPFAAEMMGY